jgi:hypothetical protein
MTVLAIPATSVPSERVFSSSGVTDAPHRSKLAPYVMEVLQVLKFNHRNGGPAFATGMLEDPEALHIENLEAEELSIAIQRGEIAEMTALLS